MSLGAGDAACSFLQRADTSAQIDGNGTLLGCAAVIAECNFSLSRQGAGAVGFKGYAIGCSSGATVALDSAVLIIQALAYAEHLLSGIDDTVAIGINERNSACGPAVGISRIAGWA
jgi:hypothetical protein